jgi:hypothetical protein
MPIKLTTKEFIKMANKVHGNKHNYNKVVYINNHTKVIIICPKHGKFMQTPNNHLAGKSCPKCGGSKKLTIKQFIFKAIKIYGNKYDYHEFDYKNSRTPSTIMCNCGRKFKQTADNHLRKHGCPRCGGKERLVKKSFIIRAKLVHKNKYRYDKIYYINNKTKINIYCKKCKLYFKQAPDNHLSGKGCPHCKKSKGEILVAKILDLKNIKYIKQKTFTDCINPKTNHRLIYDYYLPKQKILIEYNGEQHYRKIGRWHNSKHSFTSQQYRDKIKKEYALKNGYNFIVIKYDNKNIEGTIINAVFTPTS